MRAKFILILCAVWMIQACTQSKKEQGFSVVGNIENLGTTDLVIYKFVNGEIALDTITTKDNKFQYLGKVKEPYFVQVMMKKEGEVKKLTEFMLENSDIQITGNDTDYDVVEVKGSTSDGILKQYLADDDKLNNQWDDLKKDYDHYVTINDTINRKKTAKKLNQILMVDRVDLLKKYVHDYADTTTGALLPNFCTIEKYIKEEDYKELYESLTPNIQQTDYGKQLLSKWNNVK